jgi:aminocarboxymuconate-semialdehyde decarboxylase
MSKGTKIKVIDVHGHLMGLWTPEIDEKYRKYMPCLAKDAAGLEVLMIKGEPRYSISRPELMVDPSAIVRELDRTGVDMMALSIMPLFNYDLPLDLGIATSQMQNQAIANAVKAYPDRFVGLATVPLQDPREAAKELERAMKWPAMKGVEIATEVNGKNLDWRELWPFYEKAQELGAFILVHPHHPPGADRMKDYGLWNLLGFPTATSLAIGSIIFGGVLEDFPKLKFCFVHGGGFIPYQIGRLDWGFRVRPDCSAIIKKRPSEYFKLMYFDTITHYRPALEYLIATVGSDRIVVGTDAPFDVADPDPARTVRQLQSITASEKEKILGMTAARILGIEGA